MDAQTAEDARQEGLNRLAVRFQQRNMRREAAAMRAREARTTYERLRLKREADLRDANAAIMIEVTGLGVNSRRLCKLKLELKEFQKQK